MDWDETAAELRCAWSEQPVIMPGLHGQLYGIFTSPAPETRPVGVCVILLSRNRWWSDRVIVKSARRLASRGFSCLRFDYHGYGESAGSSQMIDSDKPYTEDAVAAIRFMRSEFGQQRFALYGFCFDGRTALSAIEEEGSAIGTIVCISIPVTGYPGDLLSRLLTVKKLRTFLRLPTFHKKRVIGLALRRAVDALKIATSEFPSRERLDESQLSKNFKREFSSLVRSKIQCLFLYGTDDHEYHAFQLFERSLLARLEPDQRSRITIEVWPGWVHMPQDPALQRKIMERTQSWLEDVGRVSYDSMQYRPMEAAGMVTNGSRL